MSTGGIGKVYFAQVSNFSDTNDAVARTIAASLGPHELEVIRVWPIFKKNPFLVAVGIGAALWFHGVRGIDSVGALIEKIIKTPVFFRIASAILRKRILAGGGAVAVLQTQGLFDAGVPGVPLVVYTDDVLLNPLNRHKRTIAVPPDLARLETALYRKADRIAVAATHVASSMCVDYGIAPEKITTVFMGANVPVAVSGEGVGDLARHAAGRVLFVGLDWERKGGPELVEAFTRVAERHPRARLIIAGSSPVLDHPAISVLGTVSPGRVAELMAEASIFAMPSRVEPFGIATVEAALAGLPAVGTTTGGFLDIVVEGETGLLVPPGDVDALEAALERLVADPRLCLEMGCKAAARARERFEWRSVSKQIAALIEATIAERARDR